MILATVVVIAVFCVIGLRCGIMPMWKLSCGLAVALYVALGVNAGRLAALLGFGECRFAGPAIATAVFLLALLVMLAAMSLATRCTGGDDYDLGFDEVPFLNEIGGAILGLLAGLTLAAFIGIAAAETMGHEAPGICRFQANVIRGIIDGCSIGRDETAASSEKTWDDAE